MRIWTGWPYMGHPQNEQGRAERHHRGATSAEPDLACGGPAAPRSPARTPPADMVLSPAPWSRPLRGCGRAPGRQRRPGPAACGWPWVGSGRRASGCHSAAAAHLHSHHTRDVERVLLAGTFCERYRVAAYGHQSDRIVLVTKPVNSDSWEAAHHISIHTIASGAPD